MIDFADANLELMAIHHVGNQHLEEENFTSENLFHPSPEFSEILLEYFIKPFKRAEEVYRFKGEGNPILEAAKEIFKNDENILDISKTILEHLAKQSRHPNIKPGELSVVYFSNIILDDEVVDCIGIFKSEEKKGYFEFSKDVDHMVLKKIEGVSMEKIDKACLIVKTEMEDGLRVMSVDTNRYDALYWLQDFLGLEQIKDENFHTRSYIELCTEFSKEVIAPSMGTKEEARVEQKKFLDNSAKYFSDNDTFDFEKFSKEVAPNENVAEELKTYRQSFELEDVDGFDIAHDAFSKAFKNINSIIRLDTHMQIRLNAKDPTQRDAYLEKGFDNDRGMNFYKLFFNKEK